LNSIKKLAGQTVIYGLGTIAPRLLNYLLLTPFYTTIFKTNEYGVVIELYAYVALAMVILTFGMETTYFRFASTEKNKNKVYSTSALFLLAASVLFIFVINIFTPDIADKLSYSNHHEYFIWLGIILGIDAFLSIPFAKLRNENRAVQFTIIKVLNIFTNIGFNLLFLVYLPDAYKDGSDTILLELYNPEIGVGYAFIANLIASAFTFVLLIPEIFKIRLEFDIELFKRMLKYAYPLVIIGIAGMINEVSDKYFLRFYLTIPDIVADKGEYINSVIGIYGANTKIAVLMTIFIQMFKFAAEPFFFAQAKEKDSHKTNADVMKYFVIFGLLIFLGVMLFLDIVKYFIDPKFHEGLYIVWIILLANLFLGIFYNLSIWYKLSNKTRYGAIIALTGATVTILINYVFVPEFGYIASAWARFSCYFLMMVFSYFWGRKIMRVDYDLKQIAKYVFIALIIYIISTFNTIDGSVLKLAVNFLLYIAFLAFVVFSERKTLQLIVKK